MNSKIMPYVYFQGTVKKSGEAQVSLACNSLQYGTTCFAGIRGYYSQYNVTIFRLKDHHERLMNASKIMGFDYHIPFESFHEIIDSLVRKNRPTGDFYIRPFLFAADEQLAPKPLGLTFDLAIYMVPLGNYFDPSRGMRLMISSWRKFPDVSLPTKAKAGGCYVNSFLATAEALRCGYDEALLADQDGYIVEAAVANILVAYRGRYLIPEVGSAQLEGITMRTVVELLQEEGHEVHFEKIDRSMIYTCDELMLLGTAAQVAFAESVDNRTIGTGRSGPTCHFIRSKLRQVMEGRHPKSKEWLTAFSSSQKGDHDE